MCVRVCVHIQRIRSLRSIKSHELIFHFSSLPLSFSIFVGNKIQQTRYGLCFTNTIRPYYITMEWRMIQKKNICLNACNFSKRNKVVWFESKAKVLTHWIFPRCLWLFDENSRNKSNYAYPKSIQMGKLESGHDLNNCKKQSQQKRRNEWIHFPSFI